jgi:hypothetical protein
MELSKLTLFGSTAPPLHRSTLTAPVLADYTVGNLKVLSLFRDGDIGILLLHAVFGSPIVGLLIVGFRDKV